MHVRYRCLGISAIIAVSIAAASATARAGGTYASDESRPDAVTRPLYESTARPDAAWSDRADAGDVCTQKSIFFDLGNQPFRGPEANGALDREMPFGSSQGSPSVGGNLPSGTFVSGCLHSGRFIHAKIYDGEPVRVVLLNPRPDLDYGLLHQNGVISSGEASSATLPNSSPLDEAVEKCKGANDQECEGADRELELLGGELRSRLQKFVAVNFGAYRDGGSPDAKDLQTLISCDARDWIGDDGGSCARIATAQAQDAGASQEVAAGKAADGGSAKASNSDAVVDGASNETAAADKMKEEAEAKAASDQRAADAQRLVKALKTEQAKQAVFDRRSDAATAAGAKSSDAEKLVKEIESQLDDQSSQLNAADQQVVELGQRVAAQRADIAKLAKKVKAAKNGDKELLDSVLETSKQELSRKEELLKQAKQRATEAKKSVAASQKRKQAAVRSQGAAAKADAAAKKALTAAAGALADAKAASMLAGASTTADVKQSAKGADAKPSTEETTKDGEESPAARAFELAQLRQRADYFEARRLQSCMRWSTLKGEYERDHSPAEIRELAFRITRFSNRLYYELTTYTDVQQLLGIVARVREDYLDEAFGQRNDAGPDAGPDAGIDPGNVAFGFELKQALSYGHFSANWRRWCAIGPERKIEAESMLDGSANFQMSSAMFSLRRTLRMIDHAQEARIFGLEGVEGNTDVLVTIYGTPKKEDAQSAGGMISIPLPSLPPGRVADEDGGVAVAAPALDKLKPFQFTYHVESRRRIAVSVGLAASLHLKRGALKSLPSTTPGVEGYGVGDSYAQQIVSAPPPPVLFVSAMCPEYWRCANLLSVGLGVELSTAQDLVGGKGFSLPHVYLGAQLWVTRGVALGFGLSEALARPAGEDQLGVFFAATVDIPTAKEVIDGVNKIVPK